MIFSDFPPELRVCVTRLRCEYSASLEHLEGLGGLSLGNVADRANVLKRSLGLPRPLRKTE
eukprot:1392244-Prymnesium_polylepis.1